MKIGGKFYRQVAGCRASIFPAADWIATFQRIVGCCALHGRDIIRPRVTIELHDTLARDVLSPSSRSFYGDVARRGRSNGSTRKAELVTCKIIIGITCTFAKPWLFQT